MPERDQTIQVTIGSPPVCDWQTAETLIGCLDGRVVVEMAPWDGKRGVLFLPDALAANLRPDAGIVIASGVHEIEPGDCVLVRGYDGTWRDDFRAGEYESRGQVRFYGVFVGEGSFGEAIRVPYWESIIAKLSQDMQIQPIRDNILVKRDPILDHEGSVLLVEDHRFRTNAGTVVATGPGKWDEKGKEYLPVSVKPGDRVIYHPEGMLDLDMNVIGGDVDLCIMPEDSIEAVIGYRESVTGIRQKGLAVAA